MGLWRPGGGAKNRAAGGYVYSYLSCLDYIFSVMSLLRLLSCMATLFVWVGEISLGVLCDQDRYFPLLPVVFVLHAISCYHFLDVIYEPPSSPWWETPENISLPYAKSPGVFYINNTHTPSVKLWTCTPCFRSIE